MTIVGLREHVACVEAVKNVQTEQRAGALEPTYVNANQNIKLHVISFRKHPAI
jgi:hypothetical protein